MKDAHLVSVIIPTYNRSNNLENAIKSVLSQTYASVEVIVVDDNGKDTNTQKETQERMSKFLGDERVKYIIRDTNGGGGAARNTGIENSIGDIITFLDDDDLYLINKVERQVSIIDSGYDISLCSMVVQYETGEPTSPEWSYAKGDSVKEFVLNGNSYTPMIMLKRNILTGKGDFINVKMLQDHIFMLNLCLKKPDLKINATKEKLYIHNIHSEDRVSKKKNATCFEIKNSLENKLSYLLTEKEKDELKMKQQKELSILYSENGDYLKAILFFSPSVKYISRPKLLLKYGKTMARLVIGSKLYEKIKRNEK